MEIRYAQNSDIEGWLTLVRLTSDSFPGLQTDSFRQAIESAIENKTAYVAVDLGKVAGAIAFSRENSEILFLAVRPDFRKQGIGTALVQKTAEDLLTKHKLLYVTTFRDNDRGGRAAVSFYKSLGFKFYHLTYEYGYPCQVLALSSDKVF